MNENKKKMYDLSGPKTVEAMKKRHFDAYYCSTAAEAVEKALELIPKTDSVSWGGVMTVDELGLKQRLAQEGYTLIDRDTAKDPAEKQALMHQALSCGTFLMSSNAISKDGQLVNIDGMGNRVAAMCYGPRQVVVIAGMNKVLGTLDDAIARARNIAAPANAQRFGIKTPCGLTGQCGDCTSPDCICSYVVVTRYSMVHERIKVILVGEDPGSVSYVTGKAKASAEVGIRNTTIRKPESISEEELLGIIAGLNADPEVDGILVQLPLPKHIDEDKVIAAIDKAKDVDGFHPLNVAALWQKQPCTLPCTPKGIIKMLKAAGVEIAGKRAVVIGRSNIVGLPVSKLLLDENATVTMTHSRTRNLGEVTRGAEILVVAIGRPKFVTADMVSEGTVVIDVGVNRDPETGKLCGDVDFAAVEPKASVITPVPGGVGPMTICCLMENTIECFLRSR